MAAKSKENKDLGSTLTTQQNSTGGNKVAFKEMRVDFFPKKGRQGLLPPRSFSTSEECPLPSQTHQQQIPSNHENVILKDKIY